MECPLPRLHQGMPLQHMQQGGRAAEDRGLIACDTATAAASAPRQTLCLQASRQQPASVLQACLAATPTPPPRVQPSHYLPMRQRNGEGGAQKIGKHAHAKGGREPRSEAAPRGGGHVQIEPSKTMRLPDLRMMIWPLTTSIPAFNSVCTATTDAGPTPHASVCVPKCIEAAATGARQAPMRQPADAARHAPRYVHKRRL